MSPFRRERLGPVLALVFEQPLLRVSVLEALERALAEAPGEAVVLCSRHPRIFLAGADLGEILRLDHCTSRGYAEVGRRVLAGVAAHPRPVVAAVDGACTGGGFDLVLACDRVVVGAGARFAHPGVRRGLVTGWGGTTAAPPILGPAGSRRAFLTGLELSAAAAVAGGWAIAGGVSPAERAAFEADRLGRLHPARMAAWRSFRSGSFVDRFRAVVVHSVGNGDPPAERESP